MVESIQRAAVWIRNLFSAYPQSSAEKGKKAYIALVYIEQFPWGGMLRVVVRKIGRALDIFHTVRGGGTDFEIIGSQCLNQIYELYDNMLVSVLNMLVPLRNEYFNFILMSYTSSLLLDLLNVSILMGYSTEESNLFQILNLPYQDNWFISVIRFH